jgi:hypothetical protein
MHGLESWRLPQVCCRKHAPPLLLVIICGHVGLRTVEQHLQGEQLRMLLLEYPGSSPAIVAWQGNPPKSFLSGVSAGKFSAKLQFTSGSVLPSHSCQADSKAHHNSCQRFVIVRM